jgi:hypothetical protein
MQFVYRLPTHVDDADTVPIRRRVPSPAFATTLHSGRAVRPPSSGRGAPDVRVEAPRPWRRGRAGLWLALVASAAVVGIGVGRAWPERAELRVTASAADGSVDRAVVYLDGVKRCDVVPCVVRDVGAGRHDLVVWAPGGPTSAPVAVAHEAGEEPVAVATLAAGAAPPAPGPGAGR